MMWSIPIGIVIVSAYLIYTVAMFFYEKNSASYLSLAAFLIIVIVFMVCDFLMCDGVDCGCCVCGSSERSV